MNLRAALMRVALFSSLARLDDTPEKFKMFFVFIVILWLLFVSFDFELICFLVIR